MTDETLLLRLRAETLHASLTRLKSHLATPNRMVDLDGLAARAEVVRRSITLADRARFLLGEKMQTGEPIRWDDALDSQLNGQEEVTTVSKMFDKMARDLDEAKNSLRSLREAVDQMKRKCFRVTETPGGKSVLFSLGTKSSRLIRDLENMKAAGNNLKDLGSYWKKLRGTDEDDKAWNTEPIFADYMELLGGAALRDTGFDEEISILADELLASTGDILLALPMRREALVTTVKQIVRVTFPDWTLWALPSAALEFWSVVGQEKMKDVLAAKLLGLSDAQRALIEEKHYQCLGDAYATYTMGPAYAYYAIGLSFAPDSDQDQYRVRAILAMLERMEDSPAEDRYLGVKQQLLTAWNAARTQLKQEPLVLRLDNPRTADQTDPQGAGLRILMDNFFKTLESETSAKFGTAIWTETQSWVPLLLENKAAQIRIPNGVELRHLLNAAWLARVHPNRDLTCNLKPAVTTLLENIKLRQGQKGGKDVGRAS